MYANFWTVSVWFWIFRTVQSVQYLSENNSTPTKVLPSLVFTPTAQLYIGSSHTWNKTEIKTLKQWFHIFRVVSWFLTCWKTKRLIEIKHCRRCSREIEQYFISVFILVLFRSLIDFDAVHRHILDIRAAPRTWPVHAGEPRHIRRKLRQRTSRRHGQMGRRRRLNISSVGWELAGKVR